jgi:ubiquinone/menaquinone biosynthesis C-methylase UbiE
MGVIEREREFWDQHEEFDWMAEGSKRALSAMLPRLEGDVLELCVGAGMLIQYIPTTYRTYTGLDLSSTLLAALRRRIPSRPEFSAPTVRSSVSSRAAGHGTASP